MTGGGHGPPVAEIRLRSFISFFGGIFALPVLAIRVRATIMALRAVFMATSLYNRITFASRQPNRSIKTAMSCSTSAKRLAAVNVQSVELKVDVALTCGGLSSHRSYQRTDRGT